MKEIFVAFIMLCTNDICDGKKTYAKKGNFSIELCKEDARNWAIFTHLYTDKHYGWGCEKVTYEPKEIK